MGFYILNPASFQDKLQYVLSTTLSALGDGLTCFQEPLLVKWMYVHFICQRQYVSTSHHENRFIFFLFFFLFKQYLNEKVCPKSYKDSPRGLTSSIHTFHYRSKTVKRAYKSQRINMLTGSTNIHLFRYMKSVRI